MAKVKRIFIVGFLLLCIALQSLSFAACGGAGNSGEGVEPLGLYTDLQFSLHGENGQVRASVKNKFTFLPSTVTVNIELYRSESFKESVADMTLAASNYIYDLDQGKTMTATASTDGRQSFWKARAYYKIDNKPWQETFSETVLFTADGIKTSVSAPIDDDREYFISDFLQSDAETVQISIYPYKYGGEDESYAVLGNANVHLENEEEFSSIKDLFGELKLESYDIVQEEQRQYFWGAFFCPQLKLYVKYSDGKTVTIFINDIYQNYIGINTYVFYCDSTCDKSFVTLISDDTRDMLMEQATKMFNNAKENN